MAGSAIGDLVLRFTGDIAGLRTSVDQVSSTLSSLENDVSKHISSIERRFGDIAVAAALYFTTDMFKGMIEGAIQADASLVDLASRTGGTVEGLSRMVNVGKLAGITQEDIASASDKLTKALGKAEDGTKGASKALDFLGISARTTSGEFKSSDQIMEEVAVALSHYGDGISKSMLLQDLFAKGGARLAQYMKDLAEQTDITSTVTKDQAAQAKLLTDEWAKLQIAASSLWNEIASALVPVLQQVVLAFTDAGKGSDSLGSQIKALAQDGSITIWALEIVKGFVMVGEVFVIAGRGAAALGASFIVLLDDIKIMESGALLATGNFAGALRAGLADTGKLLADRRADLAVEKAAWSGFWNDEATATSKALDKQITDIQAFQKTFAASMKAMRDLPENADSTDRRLFGSAAQAPGPKPLPNYTSAAPKTEVLSEYEKELEVLAKEALIVNTALEQLFSTDKISASYTKFLEYVGSAAWNKLTLDQQVNLEAIANTTAGTEQLTNKMKEWEKESAAVAAQIKKEQDAWAALGDAVLKNADTLATSMTEDAKYMNLDSGARRYMTTLDALKTSFDAGQMTIEDYQAAVDKLTGSYNAFSAAEANHKANAEALKEQVNVWKNIDKTAETTFVDIFENGKNAFTKLRDTLKTTLLQLLYQMTVQKWIFQIGAQVTGNNNLGAAAGAGNLLTGISGGTGGGGGGGMGSIGTIGSLASSANTLMGGGSLLAGAASALGMGSAAVAAAGATFSASLATLGVAFTGGAAAVGGIGAVAMAAIPVVGWIAAAAYLIYSLVSSNKKPSDVKGTFGITAGSGGFEDSQSSPSKFGNVGFLDAGTQQFSGEVGNAFSTLVTGMLTLFDARLTTSQHDVLQAALQSTNFGTLEGTFTTEDFLNKYGPQVLKQVARAAFDVLDPALGHVVDLFTGTAQEAVTFIGNLLLLHDALASLPKDTAAQLRGALSGTLANLAQVQAIATGMITIAAVRGPDNIATNVQAALTAASTTAYDAFTNAGKALTDLAHSSDGSTASVTALTTATVAYAQQQVQLLVYINQLRGSISNLFANSIEAIRLQVMTPDEKVAYYDAKITTLQQQLLTATDPAQVASISQQINDAVLGAWNALTPAQQSAQAGQYGAVLSGISTSVDQALTRIGTAITSASVAPFAAVSDAFQRAADTLTVAANTVTAAANIDLSAANINLSASQQPLTVVVQTGAAGDVNGGQ